MSHGKVQGRPKAIRERHAAERGGAQLRRVGSDVVPLGAGLFADVRARYRRWTIHWYAYRVGIAERRARLL